MVYNNENLLETEKLERERLEKERKERVKLEREWLENQKANNKLYPNNMLFVIPSWGDLLGYPTLGTYANHNVKKIDTDLVVFLGGYDYSIETSKGTLYFLFGLGFHYLKFEIESGKYITDHRTLTGLVLSDFVYDHMASSKNITLENDRDVVIAEKVVRVPIDLSFKSENQITFIKGALMRNVFIPNKDAFLNFIEHIRDPSTYQVSQYGHMILSTHLDSYDTILVSEKMRVNPYKTYLESAAGLSGIVFGADQLLNETISSVNLQIIEQYITHLKAIFSTCEFDPMYLYSLLENASPQLRSEGPQIPTTPGTTPKQSIFSSAADRMDAFTSWPSQYIRKPSTKQEIVSPLKAVNKTYDQQAPQQRISAENLKPIEYDQEKFELNTLKSKHVEFKPLPNPPGKDIKEIVSYLRNIINQDYEMRSLGQAFEISRDIMNQMSVSSSRTLQKDIWEMSKYANIYSRKDPNLGLSLKEKNELLERFTKWLTEIEEAERLERERLKRGRLEKERREREARETAERERRAIVQRQREQVEYERLEKEKVLLEEKRVEMERLKEIQEQQERVRREKEALEQQRIKEAKAKEAQERMRKEREKEEALQKEKRELERLKRERKIKEKRAKQQLKKEKQIAKKKKKIEKKKQKEQDRIKKLDS
ncbi:MAG: MAP7 domain-containing protein [Promethearchaeota archaeon]